MRTGCVRVSAQIRVGITIIHHIKKGGTVCFLTDFREVHKQLVRKPFSLPKISTVLQELEGFTYATTLDLNMGYYTIRLDPNSSRFVPLFSLEANTLTYDYQWVLQVLQTSFKQKCQN